VSGGKNLEMRLQARTGATGEARKKIAALAADLPGELREDLQLLVSELVANSLRHAELTEDGWIDLRARVAAQTVRVEVSDPGQGFRHRDRASELSLEDKSGLWMLDKIADRWGVVRDGATHVWFETDLPAGGSDRPANPPWSTGARDWPAPALAMASDVSRLYGPPDDAGPDQLLWRRVGGFELVIRRGPAAPR